MLVATIGARFCGDDATVTANDRVAYRTLEKLLGYVYVPVLGETTRGGHSNMMIRNLPNGFGYSLPFERTFADDGVCYEGIGLTPDVPVAFDFERFVAGDDAMFDAAVELLSSKE